MSAYSTTPCSCRCTLIEMRIFFSIATCVHNQLCKGAHYVAVDVLNLLQYSIIRIMISQAGCNPLLLAGCAFFFRIINGAKLCSYHVLWSPLVDLHYSLLYSVFCHRLQLLLLHILINMYGYTTATCAPFGIFIFLATYTIALHASHYYSECSTAL